MIATVTKGEHRTRLRMAIDQDILTMNNLRDLLPFLHIPVNTRPLSHLLFIMIIVSYRPFGVIGCRSVGIAFGRTKRKVKGVEVR